MPQYAIVIRNADADWSGYEPARVESIYASYYEWIQRLERDAQLVTCHALGNKGRSLREVDGNLMDGPFAETKEVVGGFFIIESDDLDTAMRLARECPALAMGDGVDVRELSPNPARYAPK